MISNVKASLTRKLGPLPVWAWAIIGGAALYMYRTRRAGVTTRAANVDATSPGVTADAGQRLDPVTLEPGQSAYDPNTGQLATAPSGEASGGQANTGANVDPNTSTAAPWTLPPDKGSTTKRKPPHGESRRTLLVPARRRAKRKPHHETHGKPVAKQPSAKGKPRTLGRVLRKSARYVSGSGAVSQARARGAATSDPSGGTRARAAVPASPAMRQRPAAPKIVHPGTQRVEPHPALSKAPNHAAPAAHHQRPRKR